MAVLKLLMAEVDSLKEMTEETKVGVFLCEELFCYCRYFKANIFVSNQLSPPPPTHLRNEDVKHLCCMAISLR